jgi:GT2 family glycosyltransferase
MTERCSVVIPSCNEGEMLRRTVQSVLAQPCERAVDVVVVDDGSTDGSCDAVGHLPDVRVVRGRGLGVPGARNAGAAAATGDVLIFLDGHCRVTPGWADRLAQALAPADVAIAAPAITELEDDGQRGCGMVWTNRRLETAWIEASAGGPPFVVPFAPGGCQAFRAETFGLVGRFDEGMTRWGFEDIEISLRSWLLGYRVLGVPDAVVGHQFRESRGFDVADSGVLFNFLRMIHLHFTRERIARTIRALGAYPGLAEAMARLQESDVLELRAELFAVRPRHDAWFFSAMAPHLAA